MSFKVTVQPGNHELTVKADQIVLDAALDAGIFLPYSCRNGICSACKGRILHGEFDAGGAPAYILSGDELEQGYTLLCQARPRSDLVIEASDVRLASDIQIRKMPARVVEMQMLAPDVQSLSLQLPASQPFPYYAGQYIDIILRDGRRRSYSMACLPNEDNRVELHVRHMPGGVFTDHVFGAGSTAMKLREIQRVEGPHGSFYLQETSTLPIIFLASGTGFAPIKAMVERLIQTGSTRPIILYWGGRRPRDLYLSDLAKQWESLLPEFQFIPVVSDAISEDTWQGRTGFVHHAVMQDHPDLSGFEVYACGTPLMVENARNDFISKNALPETQFYADAFTSEADMAS